MIPAIKKYKSEIERNQQAFLKDLHRRRAHSEIERKRRVKMSAAFVTLQNLIPSLRSKESVQKLSILENAIAYIQELRLQDLKQETPGSVIKAKKSSTLSDRLPYPTPSPTPSCFVSPELKSTSSNLASTPFQPFLCSSNALSPCSSNVMSISYILNSK